MHHNPYLVHNIQENTAYLQFALQSAALGCWDVSLHDNAWTLTIDKRCKELLGIVSEGSVTNEQILQAIHEHDRNAFALALQNAQDPAKNRRHDISILTQVKAVRIIGQGYFDEDNLPYRFSGIIMEVASEKVPAEKSTLSEDLARAMLKGTSVGLFHINISDDKIDYSPAFAVILTGENSKNLLRENFINRIHPGDRQLRKDAYEAALQSGDVFYEARTVWNDGSIHWIRTVGTYAFNEAGKPESFSGTVQDITKERQKEQALKEAEDRFSHAIRKSEAIFRNVTSTSPAGLWMSDGEGLITYLNKTLIDWTGRKYETLLGAGWYNIIVEEDRELIADEFQSAIFRRGHFDHEFRLQKGNGEVIWCRGAGDPYYLEDGSYAGYVGFCMDINDQVVAAHKLRVSEERISAIIEQAPMAIGLLSGRDMVVQTANEMILNLWGKNKSITGKPLIQGLPEIKGQPFLALLEKVFDTGEPYYGYGMLAKLEHKGSLQHLYFDFVYTPMRDARSVVTGVMVLAMEVTQQVLSRKAVEESEAKFRGLIQEAPFATALYSGPDLIIEMANAAMIRLWGKNENVIGMPLHLALPELDGQPFLQILDNIFKTGMSYHTQDAKADLIVNGKLTSFYFNFTYKPVKNEKGEIYAILNMAVDVTDQVLARKKIEEAEESLRGAVELAELGTWDINLETNSLELSDRLRIWFGFGETETVTIKKAYKLIAHADRHLVKQLITGPTSKKFQGLYDLEYTVVDKPGNKARIIHAQGKTFFNEKGKAYKVSGTAQDVTEQRKVQLALEQEVLKRTQQLQVLNAELKSANEELFRSNERLIRSNEELAQFAYVASHDLQEPLRKIRTFSSMLNKQENLVEEGRRPVTKIMESAERMSLLIQDLLDFSRLLKSETLMRPIELTEVCRAVTNDFELSIIEKNAEIIIGDLPVIEAVGLQMNQLFYNLLSNALKFSSTTHKPRITIFSSELSNEEAKNFIPRPNSACRYYKITFEDNGIGFDVKYSEQIFEVFKRLHGRNMYPGSGIGLALCRRIVTNHKGHLYAESRTGQGAAFHIILPDRKGESEET